MYVCIRHTHLLLCPPQRFNIYVCMGWLRSVGSKIIGLFCRISSLLYGSFAKETYTLIDPINQSHPICIRRTHLFSNASSEGSRCAFAEYPLFYKALLQKRLIILSLLLTKSNPYVYGVPSNTFFGNASPEGSGCSFWLPSATIQHICMRVYMYVCWIYLHVCIYVCMYICNVNMYIFIYLYTYIFIHVDAHLVKYLLFSNASPRRSGCSFWPPSAIVQCMCMYVYMFIFMYVYMYVFNVNRYMFTYSYMDSCIFVFVYVHMH